MPPSQAVCFDRFIAAELMYAVGAARFSAQPRLRHAPMPSAVRDRLIEDYAHYSPPSGIIISPQSRVMRGERNIDFLSLAYKLPAYHTLP